MPDSPYRIPLEQFERETPRVHAYPVDADDPDGEMTPGTAFAMVEQPEPPANPYTVEGLVAGFGRLGSPGSAGAVEGSVGRQSRYALAGILVMPFLLALLIILLH